jgi:hypothetical protein
MSTQNPNPEEITRVADLIEQFVNQGPLPSKELIYNATADVAELGEAEGDQTPEMLAILFKEGRYGAFLQLAGTAMQMAVKKEEPQPRFRRRDTSRGGDDGRPQRDRRPRPQNRQQQGNGGQPGTGTHGDQTQYGQPQPGTDGTGGQAPFFHQPIEPIPNATQQGGGQQYATDPSQGQPPRPVYPAGQVPTPARGERIVPGSPVVQQDEDQTGRGRRDSDIQPEL